MIAFVGLLSLLGILVGLVSVAIPLRFLKIHNRRMAAMVLAACSATFVAALVFDGPARVPPNAAKVKSAPAQQALISPPVDDGCQMAGAIPNCKEEMAKLAAAKAANPALFEPSVPASAKRGSGSSSARNYLDDIKNRLKAEEASANMKAQAAQREYDAAKFQSEVANSRYEASVRDYEETSQRYKRELESRSYDLRLEQQRLRRGY